MKPSYRVFARKNPVRQAFHTGRWGWRRVHDCFNLNEAKFSSKRAAEINRKAFWCLEHPEGTVCAYCTEEKSHA